MSPKRLTISTAIDEELFNWLQSRAEAEERPVSSLVREILQLFCAEAEEGSHWARQGEIRLASLDERDAVSHEAAWQ